MTRCPDCAVLETRVAQLERRLADVCERCRVEDPVLRRCRNCERTLCLVCLGTATCAHQSAGQHEAP